MAEIQHLRNAPIKEALIDIRVVSGISDPQMLEGVPDSLVARYPKKEAIQVSKIGFQISPDDASSTINQKIVGYKFTSRDEKSVVQFRIDGFTFSRLEPYEDWETMCHEAQECWKEYKSLSLPESITRIAVRYINALRIPLPLDDFADYLTAPPIIPEGLPQGVSNFLTKITMYNHEIPSNCIFIQALEEPAKDEAVTIVFDIDAIIADQSKVSEYDVERLDFWQDFELLRDFKNQIFFKSITEKTVELFK